MADNLPHRLTARVGRCSNLSCPSGQPSKVPLTRNKTNDHCQPRVATSSGFLVAADCGSSGSLQERIERIAQSPRAIRSELLDLPRSLSARAVVRQDDCRTESKCCCDFPHGLERLVLSVRNLAASSECRNCHQSGWRRRRRGGRWDATLRAISAESILHRQHGNGSAELSTALFDSGCEP